MKNIEIKRMGIGSVWKVTTYMMILPAVLCFLMGILMILISIVTGAKEMLLMGILLGFAYPILFLTVYGLMGMLAAVIYNWLAGKFGGLELTIKENEPNQPG